MLKVTEFLDIEKIKKIRKNYLNKGLDEFDNFSYHLGLIENEILCGTARLYKKNNDIIIDNIALKKFDESHYELLFRAMLLKAINIGCEYIIANKEREDEFYLKFNFDKDYKAKPDKIVFLSACQKD